MFADGKVISFGQIIGIVLAPTQPLAQRAAKAVRVTYEDIHPSIITIEVHTDTPGLSRFSLKGTKHLPTSYITGCNSCWGVHRRGAEGRMWRCG